MPSSPCSRVVPKNLFLSAQRALSEEAIQNNKVTKSNLRDLCTLLSLSVLYDKLETLGNKRELDDRNKPYIATEYKWLQQFTGLTVETGPPDKEFENVLTESIPYAVRKFSAVGTNVNTGDLKKKLAGALRVSVSDHPDYWEDFAEGEKLRHSSKLEGRSSEAENFWLRSFLYAGLAAVRERPLVPDAIRSDGIGQNANPPADYAQQLQEAVERKYTTDQLASLIVDAPIPMTPFAAVVFLRAGNDVRQIRAKLKELRDELTPVRDALRSFQSEREIGDYRGLVTIFGQPHTEESRRALGDRVDGAIQALKMAKFPLPPQAVALKPVYDVINSSVTLLVRVLTHDPTLLKDARDLLNLYGQYKDAKSSNDRSTFLEVHYRLGWDLREWFNHGVRLDAMFGDIEDDERKLKN